MKNENIALMYLKVNLIDKLMVCALLKKDC